MHATNEVLRVGVGKQNTTDAQNLHLSGITQVPAWFFHPKKSNLMVSKIIKFGAVESRTPKTSNIQQAAETTVRFTNNYCDSRSLAQPLSLDEWKVYRQLATSLYNATWPFEFVI